MCGRLKEGAGVWYGSGRVTVPDCMIVFFFSPCRIVCTTESADDSLDVVDCITVRLITGAAAGSSTVFAFKVPKLTTPPGAPFNYTLYPTHGPITGGTNLSIWGEYLDIGNVRRVTVGNQTCQLTMNG